MNNVQLSGRLTRNPEVKTSQGATPITIARFNLAVDRAVKREGEQTADFINCVAFGKTAEFVGKYFTQGMKMIVSNGRIQTGSYTNKDGVKVYTTDVVCSGIEFGESKGGRADAPAKDAAPQAAPQAAEDDFATIFADDAADDDDLPFN